MGSDGPGGSFFEGCVVVDGAERFHAKRAAGMPSQRRDGSEYSPETDRDSFAAEQWAAAQFGKQASSEIFDSHGDDGYDFVVTVDSYWLNRISDGSPRRDGHLIENPWRKKWPDRFVVVSGSPEEGFRFEGWCSTEELLAEPLQDFGYGEKHAIHISKLHNRPENVS